MSIERVQARIDRERERAIEDLKTVVRIPSISSSSAHKKDVLACAEHLAQRALRAGFERAEVFPTAGHPIVVVVSDTAMLDRGRPSICYGLRGLAYFQIDLTGTSTDLHSGSFGGGVKNPLHALCEIVARLKDPKTGKILVPGFYDEVRALTPK